MLNQKLFFLHFGPHIFSDNQFNFHETKKKKNHFSELKAIQIKSKWSMTPIKWNTGWNLQYLVRNCKYNCGVTPAGSDFSLDEISKKTVKHVFLSRLHIFQAVVFPSPMTVLATAGPFCKLQMIRINSTWKFYRKAAIIGINWLRAKHSVTRNYPFCNGLTFSTDVQGPIIPWILTSFEQLISSVPLEITIAKL